MVDQADVVMKQRWQESFRALDVTTEPLDCSRSRGFDTMD